MGRIKSLERVFWNSSKGGYWCHWGERFLEGGLVGAPIKYRFVILCNDNKRKKILVHKLVYETFVEKVTKGMEIDHIDSNPLNNRLDNLQMITVSENNKKARAGQDKTKYSYIITDIETEEETVYKTTNDIMNDFNLCSAHIINTAFKRGTTKLLKGRYKIRPIEQIK